MVVFPSWFCYVPLFNKSSIDTPSPQEADAKPEASKHWYHKHLMVTLQCIDVSPMQVGSTVIVWGNQDLL